MNTLDSREKIEELVNNNEMVLVYFGSEKCGVCVDIKPKINKMLEKYPNIKRVHVDLDKSHKLGISYNMFTTPGILLFIEGKETLREARNISVDEIDRKIERYYNMIFE